MNEIANKLEATPPQTQSHTEISLPKFRREYSIPKTIHQTYMHSDLPPDLAANVKKLRDLNPEYAYKLWTDKDVHDFIYEVYGYDILELYLSINKNYGACRADLFRYLCIYKLGGVYLDIKSSLDQKLSKIILPDDEYLLSQWDNGPDGKYKSWGLYSDVHHIPGGEYQQWHIIAAPGHPFLERVIGTVLCNIQNYSVSQDGVGKLGVLRLTGPAIYTLEIDAIINLHPHRLIKSEAEGLHYNAIQNHHGLFKVHYSTLDAPIVI